jgi:ABC-type polysaccharide/polyol phosphate export permease
VFSQKLPTTAALNMWRTVLLDGRMPEASQYLAQFGWAVLLFVLGVTAFKASFNKTRQRGELGSY